jgi:hypothetical protein
VDAGAEVSAPGLTVNKILSGAGTVTTGTGANKLTVASGGSVAPGVGTNAGKLVGAGEVTFQPGSSFAVRVNGTQGAGVGFSQLDAGANAAVLAGALTITRDPAFLPTAYTHMVVLPSATATGHFDTVTGMDAGNGLLFAAIYTATGVELVPAVPGDVNLDRSVNFNDLVTVAQNYNTGGQTWATGDFTGDSQVNFNDLVLLAQRYNTTLPGEPVAGASAEFNVDLARAFASVPEPGAVGVICAAGVGALARRRRRAK